MNSLFGCGPFMEWGGALVMRSLMRERKKYRGILEYGLLALRAHRGGSNYSHLQIQLSKRETRPKNVNLAVLSLVYG